jgi:hypothetical protein
MRPSDIPFSFAAPPAPPSRWYVLLLAVAALLAYGNALVAGFQYDDFNVIVLNDSVHSWAAWWRSMPGIRPLLKLSYTANWVWQAAPRGFHLVNLAIHIANVLGVYLLVYYWACRVAPARAVPKRIAFTAALLFALHPANTEAVTYVTGRSVSMTAFFYLAGLLVFLYREGAGWRRPAFAALAFLMALGTKEIAIVFPFALLLTLWFCDRPGLGSAKPIWLACALGLVMLLGLADYRHFFATSLGTRGLTENLLTQIEGIHYLIFRPLLGLHTNIDPDLPARLVWEPDLAGKLLLPALFLLIAMTQWRRRPWLSLGIGWFFLHLAPTNSFFARLDVANDRQLYLAMLGPAFILGVYIERLWLPLRWPVTVAMALVLGMAAYARNIEYRDEISLWTATTRDSPAKARPWNNLGYAYQLAGRRDEAIDAYRHALRLSPTYPKALANLRELGVPLASGD